MPKVSVIIPTHNRASFVCEAVESVLNQTFKDFELIVVDDGSTDKTRESLEKYRPIIHYIYQEKRDRSEARNTGIKAAKGEYLAFLDDDDMWLPDKLKKQVNFLDMNPDIGLVHTLIEFIDENGCLLPEQTKHHFRLYEEAIKRGYTYAEMSKLCIMFISTVIVRKECFDKVGFFDSDTVSFEDWDLYLRIALYYRIATIAESLVRYRMHKNQTTLSGFIPGYIQTSLKHLNLMNSNNNLSWRKKVNHNFCLHLATAYYISSDFGKCQKYIIQTLKLKPSTLFRSRLGINLLVTLLPPNLIYRIRRLYHDLWVKRLKCLF